MDWVKKKLGSDLHISPYLGCYYGLNVTKAPFKDTAKLRSLPLAIDRSIIVDQIKSRRSAHIVSYPGVNNYVEQPLLFKYYDRSLQIKNAQKAYREAGYSKKNHYQSKFVTIR